MRQTVFLLTALACVSTAPVDQAAAKCAVDFQHPAPTIFSGRLTFKVFPGPPQFEDVRRGDQPEPAFILELDEDRCGEGVEYLGDKGSVATFRKVHLVEPSGQAGDVIRNKMRGLLNRHVEVKVEDPYEAHTGHHHAPVLGTVVSIESDQEGVPGADEPAMTTVRGFYSALSAGDGKEASSFVVPEKRSTGPLSARALSKFYGSLQESLSLKNVRPLSAQDFEATYTYRMSARACHGRSIVSISHRNGLNLISGIKALNRC